MIGAGRKRFWSEASPIQCGTGWEIRLDQRVLRTPGKAVLTVPTVALAKAVAAEWNQQGKEVVPQSMPMTRAANSAIDKVGRNNSAIGDMLAEYADTDLLCYRTADPLALRKLEDAGWQPWLDWVDRRFGASLNVTTGLTHVPQPHTSLDRLKAQVMRLGTFELTALHDLVAISGSLVLGLAVEMGDLDAEEAFRLSRIDEHWQASQWGRDDEAEVAEAAKRRDFLNAWRFLDLSRNHSVPA